MFLWQIFVSVQQRFNKNSNLYTFSSASSSRTIDRALKFSIYDIEVELNLERLANKNIKSM